MHKIYFELKKLTLLSVAIAALPSLSWAHCDSMEGPVIGQARKALESGNVAPTLKWVGPEHEEEIRQIFEHVLKVRATGGAAAELADRYFFETLVRIHREGEGAPYTGLRPAGDLEPIYAAADQALIEGSANHLAHQLAEHVEKSVLKRFENAVSKLGRAETDVKSGREYVAAYVEYMHLVEAINESVSHAGGHSSESAH